VIYFNHSQFLGQGIPPLLRTLLFNSRANALPKIIQAFAWGKTAKEGSPENVSVFQPRQSSGWSILADL
jgi:hypothetical protein